MALDRVVLVGEQPPERWNTDLRYRQGHSPMFPYPPRSAGGRLHDISGFSLGEWIYGLDRCNIIPEWTSRWDKDRAAINAKALIRCRVPHTVFACGRRVSDAFGYTGSLPYKNQSMIFGCMMVYIPHPSGRNPVYNDPEIRAWVHDAFQEVLPLVADWQHNKRDKLGFNVEEMVECEPRLG